MSVHYEIYISEYSCTREETCTNKKKIRPLIKKMLSSIYGGHTSPHVLKVTTEDISKEFSEGK